MAAYASIACRHKRGCDRIRLIRAMFEQQPALALKMGRSLRDQLPQRAEVAGSQDRQHFLVLEHGVADLPSHEDASLLQDRRHQAGAGPMQSGNDESPCARGSKAGRSIDDDALVDKTIFIHRAGPVAAYSAATRNPRAYCSNASSATGSIGVKSWCAIHSGRVGVRM